MLPAKHGSRRGKPSFKSPTPKRNELNPSDLVTPTQSRYDCTKKATLDSAGHCSAKVPMDPSQTDCTCYCEIRLTMRYGQEVPFQEGTCEASTTCTISANQAITITNTYTINGSVQLKKREEGDDDEDEEEVGKSLAARDSGEGIELQAAFTIGASYSWSKSVTYGNTEAQAKTLNATECGYWTFIPYMME